MIIDGFKCYDHELALKNDDFESACFPIYQKYIPSNFWYITRNKLIANLLLKINKTNKINTFLEIGCGNGYVLKHLSERFKSINFKGCDIYIESLKYAKINTSNVLLFQYNVFKPNLEEQYDCIGLFDVLEHIEEDDTALKNIIDILKPNGHLIITVPASMKIWSNNDVINKHKIRYELKQLIMMLKKTGFEIKYSNHFVFFLYPILFVKAKLQKRINFFNQDSNHQSEDDIAKLLNLKINPILNFAFLMIMYVELILIKMSVKFPFGSSIVVVATKK